MKSRTLALLVLFTFVGFAAGVRHGTKNAIQTAISRPDSVQFQPSALPDLSTFWRVWDILQESYLEPTQLDPDTMMYGATEGLAAALEDPYTSFLPPEETKAFFDNLQGDLQGIGAEITVRDGALVVIAPLKKSPAERAGILPGDIIVKIDDTFAEEFSFFEAIQHIRGKPGTTVRLTMVRPEKSREPFEVAIAREKIHVPSVTLERHGEIALVSVNQFQEDTTREFRKVVREAMLNKPKGVILDLRNNGGGYLEISVDLVSEFFTDQVSVVSLERRNGDVREQVFSTTGGGRMATTPLAVLVNEGSASASEIVAGAIQDHRRGVIFGEKSFGKGTVQEVEELPDGSSLRYTVARWLTPNGRNVDEVGIVPDRIVSTTETDRDVKRDPPLAAAIQYLEGLSQ